MLGCCSIFEGNVEDWIRLWARWSSSPHWTRGKVHDLVCSHSLRHNCGRCATRVFVWNRTCGLGCTERHCALITLFPTLPLMSYIHTSRAWALLWLLKPDNNTVAKEVHWFSFINLLLLGDISSSRVPVFLLLYFKHGPQCLMTFRVRGSICCFVTIIADYTKPLLHFH